MSKMHKTLTIELPTDVLKEIEKVHDDADKIIEGMTKVGAETVEKRIRANAPASLKRSNFMKCLRITRSYKTPSDDGINTKVAFYGYFRTKPTKTGKTYMHPAPLVANVFEYGSTKVTKQPFIRKAFSKSVIQRAMLAEQKRLSGGLLDD